MENYPTTKLCPFCAESIALQAIKCKHCGEMLSDANANIKFKTADLNEHYAKQSFHEPETISHTHSAPQKKSFPIRRFFTIAAILALVFLGISAAMRSSASIGNFMGHNTKEQIKNNITSYVRIEEPNYSYRAIGGIRDLKVTITNNTDFLLENVKVKIIYIKDNGKVWDSRVVDYNMVAPSTASILKIPDTHRGVKVQCELISVKSTALAMY